MLSKQILYCVFNFALCLQCTATSLSGNTSLISPYKPEKTVNITDVTNLPEHTPGGCCEMDLFGISYGF